MKRAIDTNTPKVDERVWPAGVGQTPIECPCIDWPIGAFGKERSTLPIDKICTNWKLFLVRKMFKAWLLHARRQKQAIREYESLAVQLDFCPTARHIHKVVKMRDGTESVAVWTHPLGIRPSELKEGLKAIVKQRRRTAPSAPSIGVTDGASRSIMVLPPIDGPDLRFERFHPIESP